MKKRITFKSFFMALTILCFVLTGTIPGFGQTKAPGPSATQTKVTLPNMITWTAYDVGSSGYVQSAAIGNALHKKYNTKLRVIPGGTNVGRLAPLKGGKVDFSMAGVGAWFAWRGIYEFANLEWGPQPIRVIWQPAGEVGFATAANANIKTWADLKGKRVAYVPTNASVNLPNRAMLGFAGLTENDVKKVMFPSYGRASKGLIEDQVDVVVGTPTNPVYYELANSPRGIYWPEFPSADKEGWARLNSYAPYIGPFFVSIAPGIDPVKPRELITYSAMALASYKDQDETLVYNLTKAIYESYDLFKDVSAAMLSWELKSAIKVPPLAPFHKGAIKYFKEIGVWTPKLEERNNKMLAEEKERMEKWKKFKEEVVEKKVSAAEIAKSWDKLEGAVSIE